MDELRSLIEKYNELMFHGYIYEDFFDVILGEPFIGQIKDMLSQSWSSLKYFVMEFQKIFVAEDRFLLIDTATQFFWRGAYIYDVVIVIVGAFGTIWFTLMWHWYDQRTYRLRDPLVIPFGPDFLYSDAQKTKWHKLGTQFAFWTYSALYYYEDNLENHGWLVPYVTINPLNS